MPMGRRMRRPYKSAQNDKPSLSVEARQYHALLLGSQTRSSLQAGENPSMQKRLRMLVIY